MTPVEVDALEVARTLIAAGIPVFAARPALDDQGQWDPAGGTGGTGYVLPSAWQKTVPTVAWLDPTARGFEDKAWRPGFALCALMGCGLDLLDIDPRHGGDLSRQQLLAEGVWPVVYGAASTPSGGTHEFAASLLTGSRDNVRPGFDVKSGQADGSGRGFAFIAPTVKVSKTTGALEPYRWTNPPDLEGLDDADDSGEALAAIVQGVRKTGAALTLSPGLSPAPGDAFASPHTGPIPDGQRHTQLLAYAGSLRARGLPFGEAQTLMERRWQDCAQPPAAGTPCTLADAVAILRDAYSRYPAGELRQVLDVAPLAGLLVVGTDKEQLDAAFPTVNWPDLWADDDTEPQWLCEPLLEAGQSIALVAPAKVGKSLLVLEIAAALAAGRPVLGNPARAALHVLYIDLENAPKMVRERLESMGYRPNDLGKLHYLSFPNLAALDSPRGGAQLLEIARRHDAQLVVIDTTSRVIEGEENSADTFKALYRHAIMPLKREGRAALRIDHAGKDLDRGARGSSAKNDDVDAVWLLAKRTETRLDLRRTHDRTGHGADLVEMIRQTDPHLSHVVTSGGATLDAVVLEVAAELDRLGVPLTAGRPAAGDALRMVGRRVATGTLIKALAHRKRAPKLSADSADSGRTQDELTPVRGPVRTEPDSRSKTVHGHPADSADSPSPINADDLSASPPLYEGDSYRTADPDLTSQAMPPAPPWAVPAAVRVVPREGFDPVPVTGQAA